MRFEFTYKLYADALYSALCRDPFYSTLEKSIEDTSESRLAMLKYMDFSMIEGQNFGELYIPKDHKYGVSVWSKPLDSKLENNRKKEKKSFLLNQLGRKALNTYQSIVDYMSEKAQLIVKSDYWYLSIVGILPQFQGQGLGPGLIGDVLAKTDSLEVATYLETFTRRNITFYNRLGYQAVDSFNEPITKSKYWLMIREPQIA